MKSLKEVFAKIAAADDTVAQQTVDETEQLDEQTKLAYQQAHDYDQVGRVLARQVFEDLRKQASEDMPTGHGPGHKHEDGEPCSPSCPEYHKSEKKASVERQILAKMAQDPQYVARLIQKHMGG